MEAEKRVKPMNKWPSGDAPMIKVDEPYRSKEQKPVKIDPNTGRLIATRDISKEEIITLNHEEWLALGSRESIHPDAEIMVRVNVVSEEQAEKSSVMIDGWKPSTEFKKKYPYFG